MQLTVPNNESDEHTPILRDHRARFQALTPASSPPGAKHHELRPVASRSSLSRRSSNISSRFFQPRASEYDAADNGLYATVGGRQWYADYTTIDWLHDVVKDSYRKAHLQQLKGVRGHLVNSWDAVQGYLLVAIIGIVTAAIAYCIDVTESLLFDLKTGHCTSNIFANKHACCAGSASEVCGEWANWSQYILETGSESFEYCIYVLFAVMFAVSASLLTMTTASERPSGRIFYLAAGSGIPEVKTILSGFVIRGFLGFRTLVVKAVGLTLGVASGLSLGKEGPFVHIACAVGNIFCRLFQKFHFNEGKRRQILSASCAAGVATAFGAPIGGVLFSLEEVSYYFPSKAMWRAFCCAVTAALTLKFLNPHATGELTLLKLDYERSWTGPDLVVYVVIAFIGGIYGTLFNNLNTLWTRRIRGLSYLKRHPVLEVLVLVILTSSFSYQNVFTRISGTDLVRKLTSPCREGSESHGLCPANEYEITKVLGHLLLALIIKIMLTVCTFGSAIPAGIFVPTMVVGSLIGRMVGLALHYVHLSHTLGFFEPNHSPAAYAMIGAAATLAGVTKMTVSLSVILFELTGSLDLVMPFMLTLLVSKWASDAIDRLSIYEKVINTKELPYLENHAIASIAEAAELLPPGRPREAITLELQGRYISAFVLREKIDDLETLGEDDVGLCLVDSGLLKGYLGLKEIKACLELITDESALCTIDLEGPGNESLGTQWKQHELAVDPANLTLYVNRTPLTLHRSAPVTLAFEMFNKLGLAYLCIMDGPDLVGVVTKKDILRYLKGR